MSTRALDTFRSFFLCLLFVCLFLFLSLLFSFLFSLGRILTTSRSRTTSLTKLNIIVVVEVTGGKKKKGKEKKMLFFFHFIPIDTSLRNNSLSTKTHNLQLSLPTFLNVRLIRTSYIFLRVSLRRMLISFSNYGSLAS